MSLGRGARPPSRRVAVSEKGAGRTGKDQGLGPGQGRGGRPGPAGGGQAGSGDRRPRQRNQRQGAGGDPCAAGTPIPPHRLLGRPCCHATSSLPGTSRDPSQAWAQGVRLPVLTLLGRGCCGPAEDRLGDCVAGSRREHRCRLPRTILEPSPPPWLLLLVVARRRSATQRLRTPYAAQRDALNSP